MSLTDLKKLSEQELMLVLAKASKYQLSEGRPSSILELGLNRRVPTFSSMGEMHLSNTNPQVKVSTIELEIILALAKPVFGLGSVKLWEIKFGKFR